MIHASSTVSASSPAPASIGGRATCRARDSSLHRHGVRFSVFWLPLSRALGITTSVVCPDLTLTAALSPPCANWRFSDLGWIYTLFFVFSRLIGRAVGGWLDDRVRAKQVSWRPSLVWGDRIAAIGVDPAPVCDHVAGACVLGASGLGLGHISPSRLSSQVVPDRRGMATGRAIRIGGGAMIGRSARRPLDDLFPHAASVGVLQTFLVLALLYFASMMAGALAYRVPPADGGPRGMTSAQGRHMVTARSVLFATAPRRSVLADLGVLC